MILDSYLLGDSGLSNTESYTFFAAAAAIQHWFTFGKALQDCVFHKNPHSLTTNSQGVCNLFVSEWRRMSINLEQMFYEKVQLVDSIFSHYRTRIYCMSMYKLS